MRSDRKATRAWLESIKTVPELNAYLEEARLTDEEKAIARMVYVKGWTRRRIATETGYSERQVARKLARIHDRMS